MKKLEYGEMEHITSNLVRISVEADTSTFSDSELSHVLEKMILGYKPTLFTQHTILGKHKLINPILYVAISRFLENKLVLTNLIFLKEHEGKSYDTIDIPKGILESYKIRLVYFKPSGNIDLINYCVL